MSHTNRFPSGTYTVAIEHERTRTAIVHVPPVWRLPLTYVLVFHGAGTDGAGMAAYCGMNELANQEGFAVVYPHGSGRRADALTWNGGPECGYAGRQNIDDVGFVERLVDRLRHRGAGPATRFFATGMSNGGLMCYRLAESLSETFAAIAPVAAAMGGPDCFPRFPVSLLHIHGTDDEVVPYRGGIGKRSLTRTPFVSVPITIQAWVRANACQDSPVTIVEPPLVDDGTTVERLEYREGNVGSRVVLVRIVGGGHTWPGRESEWDFLGVSSQNFDANRTIWRFFDSTVDRGLSHSTRQSS